MSLNLSERAKKSLRSEWSRHCAKAIKLREELQIAEASMASIAQMLGEKMTPAPEKAEAEA